MHFSLDKMRKIWYNILKGKEGKGVNLLCIDIVKYMGNREGRNEMTD